MKKKWFECTEYPFKFPGNPLKYNSDNFEDLFVRTKICEDIDQYLENIQRIHGIFWLASEGGGYGKSTMLQYISRFLITNMTKLMALPVIVHISGDREDIPIRSAFIQNLLQQVLNIEDILKIAGRDKLLGTAIEDIQSEFSNYRKHVEELKGTVFSLSEADQENKLRNLLDGVFSTWAKKGIRIVILIDEIDKLKTEEIEAFFGKNQKLFERMSDTNTVFFLTGHRSWVDNIHAGTEYSYYQGTIFDIKPFLDIQDLKKLVESRQEKYALLFPRDSPWVDEAYDKLREVTGGVPRTTIRVAAQVLNFAYKTKVSEIGPGIVTSALLKGEGIRNIEKLFRATPGTYSKLKKAKELQIQDLLAIYYNRPNNSIPKDLDFNLSKRTYHLGVEYDDEEWKNKTESLLRIECIKDKSVTRKLADDIIQFFNHMDDESIPTSLLGDVLDEVEIHPAVTKGLVAPDFRKACRRGFAVSTNPWLTRDDIYIYFRNTTAIEAYLIDKYQNKWEEKMREFFNRYWKVIQEDPNIVSVTEGTITYFRLLPDNIRREDFDVVNKIGLREVLNDFLALGESEKISFDKVKDIAKRIIVKLLGILCGLKGVKWESKYIDDAIKRKKLFHKIGLDDEIIWRIDQLSYELVIENSRKRLVSELGIEIVKNLALVYIKWRKESEAIEEGKGIEARVRELVTHFDGKVQIEIDTENTIVFQKYDSVRDRKFRVDDEEVQIDVYASREERDAIAILLGEVKRKKGTTVSKSEVSSFLKKVKQFEDTMKGPFLTANGKSLKIEYKVFFTVGDFDDDALSLCKKEHVIPINGDYLNRAFKSFKLPRMSTI